MPDPYLVECKATPLHEYQRSLRILIRFNSELLIPTVYNAFHLTNLFVSLSFSRYHVPNNSVASFSCKENWQESKFLYLLWRRAHARNVSFRDSLWWPIYIINSVDYTNLSFYTPRSDSTTVSYGTHPPLSIRTILGVWKWLLEQYLSHVTNAHFRFSEVSYHFR